MILSSPVRFDPDNPRHPKPHHPPLLIFEFDNAHYMAIPQVDVW